MKKLLFVLALTLCGFDLNATDSEIAISGYLSNNSGDPVQGAIVTCVETSKASRPSNFEFFYSTGVLSNRQNTLVYSHASYSCQTRTVNSSSSQQIDVNMGSELDR